MIPGGPGRKPPGKGGTNRVTGPQGRLVERIEMTRKATVRALQLAIALAALAAAGAGCSGQRELLSPARVVSESEGIRIASQGSEIVLDNSSAEPVRFAVVERDYFERALVLWSFGFGGGMLVTVGKSGLVKLADVPGYSNSAREVMVFWWFDRPGATNEEKAAGVRRVSVSLQ